MRSAAGYRRWGRLVAGVLVAALVLAACGNDSTDGASDGGDDAGGPGTTEASTAADGESSGDAEWDALVEDARAEGTVVLYSSYSPDQLEQVKSAFDEAYPEITLEFLRDSSATLQERIEGERSAGQVGADVLLTANPFFAENEATEGRTDPFVLAPENAAVEDTCVDEHGMLTAGVTLIGLVYNVNAIQDPRSLDDFVGHPGVLQEPETAAQAPFAYEIWGYDFIEEVAASGAPVTFVATAPEAVNAVGAGEQDWGLAASTLIPGPKEAGAPVEFFVTDPAPGFENKGIALADAAHPAAAQVLLNFLVSEDAQAILNAPEAGVSCRDGVADALEAPENLVLFDRSYVDPAYLEEAQERFTGLF